MYKKRILIQDENGILDEIKDSTLYKKKLKKMETWTVEKFQEKIKETTNTLFYVCGHEFYVSLRDMNDKGILHLGLRNFDYLDFQGLVFVHIGNNRLIYDPTKEFYKYEAEEGKKTKKWSFNRELLEENIDNNRERLDFFLSDECEKEYLKYPKTKIVGLREGKDILHKLDMYTVHKYDTTVDYDWYRNPENRVWENEFGFDFETSNTHGRNINKNFPEFYGTRATGFALSWCDPYTDEPKAVFFDFRLDYDYDENKWNNDPRYKKEYYEFLEVMKSFFDNHYKHVWAYNASFEYAMLYTLLRKFYYIQDSYALCIADDKRSSLKYNTQYYLRSPSWDDELDADFEYFDQICGEFKSFEEFKQYNKKFFEMRDTNERENSESIKEKLKEEQKKEKELKKEICKKYGWKSKINAEEIQEKFERTKTFSRLEKLKAKYDFYADLDKKDPRFIEAMYFFSEENPDKRRLLKQYWNNSWGASGVGVNNTEYGTKETNCLGLYCGIDAFVGERLGRLLMPAYGNNCYQEILNHRYIGAELKMCGIKVDKKKLLELYRFCWNVDNNYELSSNIFAQRLGVQNANPFYVNIYNKLNDTQKYWLLNYPYYFKGGKDWAGAAVILDVYDKKCKNITDPDYIPIKEIYESLGKKCSDSKKEELIDEYDLQNFTLGNFDKGDKKKDLSESSRKCHKEFRERIGNLALKYIDIRPIIREINEFAISLFKDKYKKEFYDQVAVYWIYEKELPLSKTKVQDGDINGSPNFICLFDLLDETKKNEKLLAKHFPEVTEEMLDNLRELPEDLLEKFQKVVPLFNKEYFDYYIDKYSWEDWILDLESICGDTFVNNLPSYYTFKQTLNDLRIETEVMKDVGDTNINLYENLKDINGNNMVYPKEIIYNYFSPDQIDSYYGTFVSKYSYYDYGLATRSVATCFDKYCEYKGIDKVDLKKANSKDIWKAMLEFLNNKEYRDIILNTPKFTGKFVYTKDDTEKEKEEYDWFGKLDKETGYSCIDTEYNMEEWGTKDALDSCCKIYKVIPYLFNTKTGIYNFFKIDGSILPPIINEVLDEFPQDNRNLYEKQLSRIWDLVHQGFIRQLAATCHKLLTMYIPAVDMGYVKYPYKENLDESGNDTLYGQWEYFEEYQLHNVMDMIEDKPYNDMSKDDLFAHKKGVDFLYSKECEDWWLNEVPDMWCLPPYSINTVISKRNSSPLGSMKRTLNVLNCWKFVKIYKLQHNDEICIDVNV